MEPGRRMDRVHVSGARRIPGVRMCVDLLGTVVRQERAVFDIEARVIRLTRPDGSERIDLTEGEEPAWTPDGSTLVFRANDQLWRIGRDGSGLAPIPGTAGGREPAVSPDGRLLAFARRAENGMHDIWVVSLTLRSDAARSERRGSGRVRRPGRRARRPAGHHAHRRGRPRGGGQRDRHARDTHAAGPAARARRRRRWRALRRRAEGGPRDHLDWRAEDARGRRRLQRDAVPGARRKHGAHGRRAADPRGPLDTGCSSWTS